MQLALVLYPDFTTLDIVGPHDTLGRIPDVEIRFVGPERGLVASDTGAARLDVTHTFDETPAPDIVVVPGGTEGTMVAANDERYTSWLRQVHETSTWTTSVCTGSLVLASAGLLDGVEATSHWAALELLGQLGAVPVEERVVERGKIVTAAGVSAGIDMGLTLLARIAGDEWAQLVQLGIEYDPQPPFDTGSPRIAPPEMVEAARAFLAPPAG